MELLEATEAKCFPQGCLVNPEEQPTVATVIVPELKKRGLSVEQYTRGAVKLEQPFLDQVKKVVCKGCEHFECVHNNESFESTHPGHRK